MTQPKRILYRGVPMIESWPEKIEAAQSLVSYTLDGRAVPRIRYGNEQDDWGVEQHAGFSRANFTFRVAMEKSAPHAAANCFLVIAPSMIVQTAHSLPQLSQHRLSNNSALSISIAAHWSAESGSSCCQI